MSASLILAIGGLTGVGIYLITARSLSRIVLGFSLLGHAAVLSLLTAGGPAGGPDRITERSSGGHHLTDRVGHQVLTSSANPSTVAGSGSTRRKSTYGFTSH